MGRERTDDFGRLVEVVEPKPDGDGTVSATGSLKTSYAYDELDQLKTVTQGAQTRSFKYDSLGRLIRQKLAEQTATINDAGTYVGSGGTGAAWSDAFTYDVRSNVTKRIDARGVETDFSYNISSSPDPLNRLQSMSYSTTGADTTYGTIPSAAGVSLSYMTTGDQTRVSTITTSGVATETNTYDGQNRLSEYSMLLASRSGYAMTADYEYDDAYRLTKVKYPAQYGFGGDRKEVTPSYDQASRLIQMNVENVGASSATQLSDISYNTFGQVTSLKTGYSTGNADVEQYSYDSQTGFLTNQRVYKASNMSSPLMNLSYGYARENSIGTQSGKTGQLTRITDNLNDYKDRVYEFDALRRLTKAKGGLAADSSTGSTADWAEDYTYDRYGNKTGVAATGIDETSAAVVSDGLPSLGYNTATNRISDSGWQYDNAGNMMRGQNDSGIWQKFKYDAAGRLVEVDNDSGTAIETYKYAANRSRLICETSSGRTYYAWGGSSVIQEYTEGTSSTTPLYSKSYTYAGSRLLSTATVVSTAEVLEFHHPDRLGTRLVTNPAASTYYEQSTMPFGTAFPNESTGFSNQTFTSYDRSIGTGLDYALNRTHSSGQGRFTQVDPMKMAATIKLDPQSLNLYAYSQDSPIDSVDPSGLCTFRINIVTSTTNPPDSKYSDPAVISTAQAEIARIFNQAGHQVTTDPNAKVDAEYTLTLSAGRRWNDAIASGDLGSGQGTFWTGQVDFMARESWGVMGKTQDGMGLAMGRVAVHESFLHNFLRLPNSLHTQSGASRRSFGSSVFYPNRGDDFLIDPAQAAKLWDSCPAPPTPTNYAGGGGGGGNGGGGGGYPYWWNSLQEFLRWLDSIPVGGGDDGDNPHLG